ncbi:MAG: hypothetical protein M3Q05_14940 [Bacteroidota bacterium]|nr:hypothetical protein [Bacteroidota bacterium]
MILHQDGLIILLYDPTTDILSVRWPDINYTSIPILKYSSIKLIDAINHYQITRLLIDSRDTAGEVEDLEYEQFALHISKDLAATALHKIAWVVSEDEARQARTQAYSKDILAKVVFHQEKQVFCDEEAAIAWLTGQPS